MFTQEQMAHAMQALDLPQQVDVLEGLVKEHGITEVGDALNVFMMGVLLDLDGGAYPPELVERVEALSDQLRTYNQQRNSW